METWKRRKLSVVVKIEAAASALNISRDIWFAGMDVISGICFEGFYEIIAECRCLRDVLDFNINIGEVDWAIVSQLKCFKLLNCCQCTLRSNGSSQTQVKALFLVPGNAIPLCISEYIFCLMPDIFQHQSPRHSNQPATILQAGLTSRAAEPICLEP